MERDKREVFGVVWIDNMLGPMALAKPNATAAIDAARQMREKGADKVRSVRAVLVPEGQDTLLTIG